jgi:hypothetical protein
VRAGYATWADTTFRHGESSTVPTTASLCCECFILSRASNSTRAEVRDWPVLAQSCRSRACPLLGVNGSWVFETLNRMQSSRRLERERQRNIELVWLIGRLMPDFFRYDKKGGLRKFNGRPHMLVPPRSRRNDLEESPGD